MTIPKIEHVFCTKCGMNYWGDWSEGHGCSSIAASPLKEEQPSADDERDAQAWFDRAQSHSKTCQDAFLAGRKGRPLADLHSGEAVDRLIAEAVKAERERCAQIIRSCECPDGPRSYDVCANCAIHLVLNPPQETDGVK